MDVTGVEKLAIAVPARDMVHAAFAHDYARLVAYTAANVADQVIPLLSQGTLIASQRHELAKAALRNGADAILWLDSDMRFPPDAAERLLAHNLPIVAASYSTRRVHDVKTVAFSEVDLNKWVTSVGKTGLERVNAVGMGVFLTRKEVFDNLPEPWFQIGFNPLAGEYIGEDIYFCEKARQNGFDTYIDHDLTQQIGHIGIFEFRMDHVAAVHGETDGTTDHGAQ